MSTFKETFGNSSKILQETIGINKTPENSRKLPEIPENSKTLQESPKVPGSSKQFQKTPANSKHSRNFQESPKNSKKLFRQIHKNI